MFTIPGGGGQTAGKPEMIVFLQVYAPLTGVIFSALGQTSAEADVILFTSSPVILLNLAVITKCKKKRSSSLHSS